MNVKRIIPAITLMVVLLFAVTVNAQTMESSPLLIIQGRPDTTTAPPEVRTYISLIDKGTGQTITDLAPDRFQLIESNTPVESLTVAPQPIGLAIAIVIDRGGISLDTRLKDATTLAQELTKQIKTSRAADDDMLAVIGIAEMNEETKKALLEPVQNFSYDPVDVNLALNAFVKIEERQVRTSPLYDGLDEAIRLLTDNPDTKINSVLTHRRKIIVVFSDGIDRWYSSTAREQDIIRKSNEAGISIYAIGMARGRLDADAEKAMATLASQTSGLYLLHNSNDKAKTQPAVLDLFSRLMTQRHQYLLSYNTHLPKGTYTLGITANTPTGSSKGEVSFSSILELPIIEMASPPNDHTVIVTYSLATKAFTPTVINLSATITPKDNAPRDPTEVRYFANGKFIGASTTPPDFVYPWNLAEFKNPLDEIQSEDINLTAEANDLYLGAKIATSNPLKIHVTWEKRKYTFIQVIGRLLATYWGLLLILIIMAICLVILFILLLRTRMELYKRIRKGVSGFSDFIRKGFTRPMTNPSQPGPLPVSDPALRPLAKLVVIEGKRQGSEFPLAGQVVVGREPYSCDIPLYDEHVSNPHFYIYQEGTSFYIEDRGSTNKTFIEGGMIESHQRVPLQPDANIRAGYTRLKFVYLGSSTRPISSEVDD